MTKFRKFLSVLVVMNCLTQIINRVLHKTSEQSFSQTLKSGHPEGMFSHKIYYYNYLSEYPVIFLVFIPKMGVNRLNP